MAPSIVSCLQLCVAPLTPLSSARAFFGFSSTVQSTDGVVKKRNSDGKPLRCVVGSATRQKVSRIGWDAPGPTLSSSSLLIYLYPSWLCSTNERWTGSLRKPFCKRTTENERARRTRSVDELNQSTSRALNEWLSLYAPGVSFWARQMWKLPDSCQDQDKDPDQNLSRGPNLHQPQLLSYSTLIPARQGSLPLLMK